MQLCGCAPCMWATRVNRSVQPSQRGRFEKLNVRTDEIQVPASPQTKVTSADVTASLRVLRKESRVWMFHLWVVSVWSHWLNNFMWENIQAHHSLSNTFQRHNGAPTVTRGGRHEFADTTVGQSCCIMYERWRWNNETGVKSVESQVAHVDQQANNNDPWKFQSAQMK